MNQGLGRAISTFRAGTWGIHTIWKAYMGAEPAGPTTRAPQGA